MNKYRLLTSNHVSENGTKYKKGDIIETTLDLEALFVNKFEKVDASTRAKKEGKPANDDNLKNKDNNTKDNDPEGEDVTEKFPDAVEVRLVVRKVGKLYVVTDPDDKEAGQLDEGDLTSQSKVNDFIAEYTE